MVGYPVGGRDEIAPSDLLDSSWLAPLVRSHKSCVVTPGIGLSLRHTGYRLVLRESCRETGGGNRRSRNRGKLIKKEVIGKTKIYRLHEK